MLVQASDASERVARLKPIGGIKSTLADLFKWNGPGSPPPDRFDFYFAAMDTSGTGSEPTGSLDGYWWQKPGTIGVYILRDIPGNSPIRPSLLLGPNARWYTARTNEEKQRAYWGTDVQREEHIVREDLVSLPDTDQNLLGDKALAWCRATLTPGFQPPSGLEFTSITDGRTKASRTAQIRYAVADKVITIQASASDHAIEVEYPVTDPRKLLSEEKVEDILHAVIANSDTAQVSVTSASDTEGSGSVSSASGSADRWLNSVKWWQEPGRVVFYWTTPSK
jgi:hypothetical protein